MVSSNAQHPDARLGVACERRSQRLLGTNGALIMTNRDDSAKLSEPLVVNEFPTRSRRENEWITLSDGVRLAANLVAYQRANEPCTGDPEYLPHARDGTATRTR